LLATKDARPTVKGGFPDPPASNSIEEIKMEKLHISVTNLAAFKSAKFCGRCVWYLLRMANRVPFRKPFPGVMTDLDRLEKAIVRASLADGEAPDWLGPFADAGEPFEVGLISHLDAETGVELAGIPDAVAPLGDESYLVLEDKTARYKGEGDLWLPVYAAQDNGYAFLLARQDPEYQVTRGGILYFRVEPDLDDDALLESLTDCGFRAPICATAVEVEIDPDEIIPPLLKQAREILDLEAPPKGRSGCEDCELLASLIDLYGIAEVADKLAHTWKDKKGVPLRRVLDYRLERRAARADWEASHEGANNGGPEGIDPEGMLAVWDWTDK